MPWISNKEELIFVVTDELTKKVLDYAYNEPAAIDIGSKYALAYKISVKVIKFKSIKSITF